ncbi:MAG: peroxiredoxin family protein, partial [Vicinamibacterales bacterium]
MPARIALCLFFVGGLIASGVGSSPLVAQQPAAVAPAPDVRKLGPQVGDRLPAFSLQDQAGRPRTLESLMGPKGLMLTFSRSASWCPYCKTQLVEMQGRLADIRQSGYEMAVITYDPVPVLAEFATRRQITFPLLSDAGSAVIKVDHIDAPLPT